MRNRKSLLKYIGNTSISPPQGTTTIYHCKICKESYETPERNDKGEPICEKCQKPLTLQKRKEFENAKCDKCKETFQKKDINSYLPNGVPQCPKCKTKLTIEDNLTDKKESSRREDTKRKFSTHIKICKKCKNVILMDKLPASNYLPDGRPFCGRCRTPLFDLQAVSTSESGESDKSVKHAKIDSDKVISCPKCKSKYTTDDAENGEITCKVCRWRLDCRDKLSEDQKSKAKKDNPDVLTCRKCKSISVLSHHPPSQFLSDGTPFCGRCKTPLKETKIQIKSLKVNARYENIKKVECIKCYHVYDISTLPEAYFLPDGSPRCPMCKARHVLPPKVNIRQRCWNPPERVVGRCKFCYKMIYLSKVSSYSYNDDGIPLCIRCSRPLLDDDMNPLYTTIDINSPEALAFLQKCDMMENLDYDEIDINPIENIYCCLDDGFVTCIRCSAMVDIKKAKRLINGQPYCGNCKQPCFSVNDLPLTIQFLQNINRFREMLLSEKSNPETKCGVCSSTIDVLNLPLFCYLPNGEPMCKNCSCKDPLETDVTIKFAAETNETKAKLGNLYKCCYCNRTFGLDKLCKEHFSNTGIPKCIYCDEPLFTTAPNKVKDEDKDEIAWSFASPINRDSDQALDALVNMRNVLADITPYTRCHKCQQLLFHKNHPIDHFTPTGDLICTKCNNHIGADTVGVDKGYCNLASERRQKGLKMQFHIRKMEDGGQDEFSGNILKRFINSLNNYGYPERTMDREYDVAECYKPGYLGIKSPLIVNDETSAAANVLYSHEKLSLRGKRDDEYNKDPWMSRLNNRNDRRSQITFVHSGPPFSRSKDFSLPPIISKDFRVFKPKNPIVHDRKILVLVDDSEASKLSFKWFAYNIMDSQRDVVVLLMMIESHQYKLRNLEPPLIKQFGKEENFEMCISKFKKMSSRYTKILEEQSVEYVVLNSATCLPEDTIVNVAYNQNPDLLVLAYQPYCLKFPVYRTLSDYLRACLATPMLFVNNEQIATVDIDHYMSMKHAQKLKQDFRRKTIRYSIMV